MKKGPAPSLGSPSQAVYLDNTPAALTVSFWSENPPGQAVPAASAGIPFALEELELLSGLT